MTYNVENPTALSETTSALKLLLNNLAKHQTFSEKENIPISCQNQPTNLIHNQLVGDHKNQKTCEAKSSKYLPLPIQPKKKKTQTGLVNLHPLRASSIRCMWTCQTYLKDTYEEHNENTASNKRKRTPKANDCKKTNTRN